MGEQFEPQKYHDSVLRTLKFLWFKEIPRVEPLVWIHRGQLWKSVMEKMNMKCLILNAGSEFQFRRACAYAKKEKWQVAFIVKENEQKQCQEICDEFKMANHIKPLRYDANNIDFDETIVSFIKENQFERIYIVTPAQKPVRFLENEHHMNLGDVYEICRALNRTGVRDISFINSNQILHRRIDNLLDDFTGYGEGKRCFIIGNGPSLNRIDMKKLKNEITFGCNRGYLGFEAWGFAYTFWAAIDRIQIEHHFHEWETSIPDQSIKLFPFEYCSLFNFENICPVNFIYDVKDFPCFSDQPGVVNLGFTTVHFLLQVAVIMGFKEIVLVGVDNRYNIPEKMIENDRWTDKQSTNHFHKNYCEQGRRVFVPPRKEKSDAAFRHASDICAEKGVRVINATPGSALTCFPNALFETLFD